MAEERKMKSGFGGTDRSPRFVPRGNVDELLKNAVPENTRKATDMWVSVLESFCLEQKIELDLSACTADELNSVLCQFYPALRTKKGELYKRSSYLAARAAIHRRLQELQRPFRIFGSEAFQRSHAVLDAILKEKKAEGQEPLVQHKEAITEEDRRRLDSYFEDVLTCQDPVKLTMYVWYKMTLHFALRGREVQSKMKKTDIEVLHDETGEFVVPTRDFCSKNCQGGIDGREFVTAGRIQGPKQVAAIRLLLAKLHPDNERLFQRARQGIMQETDKTWFTRQVLGHNLLGNMMDRLGTYASLSKRYTNHCVRSTAVTLLKSAGVEDRTVCLVTGHKNERSLNNYAQLDSAKCKDLSKCLDSPKGVPLLEQQVSLSSTPQSHLATPAGAVRGCSIVAPGAVFNNLTIALGSDSNTSGFKRKRFNLSMSATKRRKVAGDTCTTEASVSESSQMSVDF